MQAHQCLAGIRIKRHVDHHTLWKEASTLNEEPSRKIDEESTVSKKSISMKVVAAIKYLEAGIQSSNEKIM